MKSYFAKLAARATLVNVGVPGPPSIPNSRDPFEQTVIEPIAPPTTGVKQSTGPIQSTMAEVSFDSRAGNRERPRRETDNVDTGLRKVSESLIPPHAETLPSTVSPYPGPDTATPIDLSRTEKDLRVTAYSSRQLPDTIESPPQMERLTTLPAISRKDEVPESPRSGPKERLAEIVEEHTVLLRKADAFMTGLFGVRTAAAKEESDTQEVKRTESAKLDGPHHPPMRLQPVSRPARVAEPVDEEPSLVIGNLSVEVLAPAPVQVSPPQRIIVVGGGRQSRAGVPSSQRFGFSRF